MQVATQLAVPLSYASMVSIIGMIDFDRELDLKSHGHLRRDILLIIP